MSPRLRFLTLMLLGVLACGRGTPRVDEVASPAVVNAWTRFDLWFDRPRPESRDGVPQSWTARRVTVPLGRREVRDRAKVSAWHLQQVPWLSAGEIHALEQQAGTRLVVALELGDEPFFSFIPLPDEKRPCACVYRVGVRPVATTDTERDSGAIDTVLNLTSSTELDPPPATETVELSAYAGREIELILEIDAPDASAPFALWGSPAVYSRKPLATLPPGNTERPNVLILGIDTLRARALGVYGRQPSLTPAIDRLASESDVWLNAFATANATNPSFASIMTGLYCKNHGVYDNRTRLGDEHPTLAELFARAGYTTGAILAARHLELAGLERGFTDVVASQLTFAGELGVDLIASWIADQDRPFFAWVHLFDPHTPHTPPAPYAVGHRPVGLTGLAPSVSWEPFREPGPRVFAEPELGGEKDLYDGEVAYLDRQIDRLFDFLDSRGLLETTIIVFVADHGENLEEHGIRYNHVGLWDTTVHVPLMIRWPGERQAGEERRGHRLDGLVQTHDLFPTLLRAAGLEPPSSDGEDLLGLDASPRRGRRAVFAEHAGGGGAMVRTRNHKVFVASGAHGVADGTYAYDLVADPGEEHALGHEAPVDVLRLVTILERWRADRAAPDASTAVELSPEDEERLRALGYL